MLVILSPAKTMNMQPGKDIPQGTEPKFNFDAEFLAQKMSCYSSSELSRLLKISDGLSQITYERYQKFNSAESKSVPAIFAYAGSVFKAISVNDFTSDDLEYAQERVRIISTLYGLLRPLDLIKAYRIAFNLKLNGMSGNLYDYWYDKLSVPLMDDAQKVGGMLVNLASLDVMASLDMTTLSNRLTIITPEFKELRGGKYEVVRTYAKIARGAMTRFIIKERAETPQALTDFEWNGYKFNKGLSDDSNYIYTR